MDEKDGELPSKETKTATFPKGKSVPQKSAGTRSSEMQKVCEEDKALATDSINSENNESALLNSKKTSSTEEELVGDVTNISNIADGMLNESENENKSDQQLPTEQNQTHTFKSDKVRDSPVSENGSSRQSREEDTNIKSVDSGLPDSEDEMYLKDVTLGFDDEDNLKQPLTGFTEVHEAKIFPMVDEQSMMLYEIVQTMESKQMAADIASILSHKEPIVVPRSKYLLPGGGDISMRIINTESPQKTAPEDNSVTKSDSSDSNEICFSNEKLALLMKPLNNGWKREIVMRSEGSAGRKTGDVYYYTPENVKLRSSKQVAQYLAKHPSFGMTANNFSFAKGKITQDPTKEIVRTAFDGKASPMKPKTNQKSDIGSDDDDLEMEKASSKLIVSKSSSSRRSIQPPKRYATGENVFYPDKKTKISAKSSERDRDVNDSMMEMGMLPPKYPKGKEDTSNSATPLSLSPDTQQEVRRRGRPPKPGGKKDLLVQAQALAAAKEAAGICNETDDNDSMFQISAFRQSHSLMEAAIEYQGMQDNMEIDSDSGNSGNPSVPTVEENSFGGYNQNSEQLLPCSIRCAGMTGEIPTLQCKRCLCLYHPECLGLPPNLNFKNFLCSNCEGESPEERMPATLPALNVKPKQPESKKSIQDSKKGGEVKKPPPPLIRANFPKLPNKFMNEMRARLPPPSSRLPLLQPSMPFGRGGIRIRQKSDMSKLTPPHLSMLRPVSSDVTMSIQPISMKRGRGRPPKNSKIIPQLSRNLTITPISIPKKVPPPPVPNLHPVGPAGMFQKRPVNVKPDWVFSKSSKGTIAKAIANIKSTSGTAPPKLKLPQQKKDKQETTQILQQQKELNKDKGKGQVDSSPSPPPAAFRRYTQSVVTIGQKKFVVIPKNSDRNAKPSESELCPSSAESNEIPERETASPTPNVETSVSTDSSSPPSSTNNIQEELNNIDSAVVSEGAVNEVAE